MTTERLQAFLSIGFHGCATDMRDSADVEVIADLHGGQFDLYWCSIACMRVWLLDLLRQVELEAGMGLGRGDESGD